MLFRVLASTESAVGRLGRGGFWDELRDGYVADQGLVLKSEAVGRAEFVFREPKYRWAGRTGADDSIARHIVQEIKQRRRAIFRGCAGETRYDCPVGQPNGYTLSFSHKKGFRSADNRVPFSPQAGEAKESARLQMGQAGAADDKRWVVWDKLLQFFYLVNPLNSQGWVCSFAQFPVRNDIDFFHNYVFVFLNAELKIKNIF
ncbi:MAG: hypothetical protein PHS62_02055 [Patescibacteria group bacterium]|nr:hypothetical protein [Patescibacteria group bacterium]